MPDRNAAPIPTAANRIAEYNWPITAVSTRPIIGTAIFANIMGNAVAKKRDLVTVLIYRMP